jgi:hypothetical protein
MPYTTYTYRLTTSIPDDVTADMLKNLEIAVTPTFTKPKLVRGFQNKTELIEAIMASCHVPVFLNGMPYTTYRGERVIDGSFWYFVTKDRTTGLPLPSTQLAQLDDIYWIDYTDDEDFLLGTCVCMYVCMYVYVCMCMYVYVCMCVCMYLYWIDYTDDEDFLLGTCVCMYVCMYVCVCMYVYVCMCMYVCVYVCIYTG